MMPIRRVAASLVVLLLVQVAMADSLPEALRQALSQHPEVRGGEAMRNAMNERLNQARSNYYPTVGVDLLAQNARDRDLGVPRDRDTRRADAFLRWNLFRGLGDRQAERTAEHELLAAESDLGAATDQVALQAIQAYLDVARLRRLLELDDAYRAELARLDQDVAKRVDAGRIPPADREQSRASLIQAGAHQAQLRGQLRGAEIRYRLMMGNEPGPLNEPVLDDSAARLDLDALMTEVLTGNHRLRSAGQRAVARGMEVGVAESALYPRLDLELRRRLHDEVDPLPQTETQHAVQLQLNYQMPLGGGNFSRKREAVERKLAAQAHMEAEALRAKDDIAQSWASWREAREVEPRLAERVEASDRVVKAYDLQFEAGRRSIHDLIGVRGDRYQARVDLLENRMRQLALNAQVLALLGRLRTSVLGDAGAP